MAEKRDDPLAVALRESKQSYLARARIAARKICMVGETITVDDLRDYFPPPDGVTSSQIGNVFKTVEWKHEGYRRSTRPSSHGRTLSVFRRMA